MSAYRDYNDDLDQRREALLDAMLDDVPFDGWSQGALCHAAKRLGMAEAEAELTYPRGLPEIARAWSNRSDGEMLRIFETMDLESMRVRDRIAAAVRVRIEVNGSRREALRRLIGWLSLPTNAFVAMSNALRTVNLMWYAAGDESADWNYYSKRGLLLPVYSTTVLYWLADDADENGDYPATWAYLDRRIDNILKAFGFPRKVKARIDDFVRKTGQSQRRRRHGA